MIQNVANSAVGRGEDALGILEIQRAELDDAYLVDWAARLGIANQIAWLMSAEAG